MQKTPFRFNGFAVPKGENISLSNDMILATPWGAEFSVLISRRCGRGLRYAVTEPYLLNDTVRQLDYVVGLKRVMVAFTRTALDANVNPEDLIVSFGASITPSTIFSARSLSRTQRPNPAFQACSLTEKRIGASPF